MTRKGKTYEELYGKEKSEKIKEKSRLSHLGKSAWNKGIKQTSECVACHILFNHHSPKNPPKFCSRKCFIENAHLTSPKTKFGKGHLGWNLGKKMKEETKQKMRLKLIGRRTWNKGLKGFNEGHVVTMETRMKIGKKNKGKIRTEENKRKISISRINKCTGKDHPNWNGGSSFETYPSTFNKQLKNQIKERDNFTCQLCGDYLPEPRRIKINPSKTWLVVHHIDYNKKNCSDNNLITLCNFCNLSVNKSREQWIELFQDKIEVINNGLLY